MIEYALAESLIDSLRVLAFASLALSFSWQIATGDKMDYKVVVRMILLTSFLAFYGNIVTWGGKACDDLLRNADQQLTQKLAELAETKAKTSTFSDLSFVESLSLFVFHVFQTLTGVIKQVESYIREFFIFMMKISAPLAIAMGAWRMFDGVLGKFIQGTVWICFFNLAFGIADAFLFKIVVNICNNIGWIATAAIISPGLLAPAFIKIFVFMLIFYLLSPIILYKILSGGDITTAITDAVKTAAQLTRPAGAMAGAVGGAVARLPGAASAAMEAGGAAKGGIGTKLGAAGKAYSAAMNPPKQSQSDVIADGVSKALSGEAGKNMAADIANIMTKGGK